LPTISEFHHVWLRDNCQCQQCLHPSTRQKLVSPIQLDLNVRPTGVNLVRDGANIEIEWTDGHRSTHTADFLRRYDYGKPRLAYRLDSDHRHETWDSDYLQGRLRDLWVSHADVISDSSDGLYRLLSALQAYGLAFIHSVPVHDGPDQPVPVEGIAQRIGPIRETFYGRSWDVKSVVDAKNIAYTSLFLGLHMDLMQVPVITMHSKRIHMLL
jgi:hypothetical protein